MKLENKTTFFLLALILIAGIFLRFNDLGQESFWTDEAVSLLEANQETPEQIIKLVTQYEGSPYGHHLILHYWINFFGQTEFSVRLISVLFGVLSIILIFFLIKMFFDNKIALLTSLFLSTSMLQVLYAQEARLYALFGFLAILSTYFFAKFIYAYKLKKKHNFYLFSYALTIIVAMYVNYLTLFLLLLHFLALLFTYNSSQKSKSFKKAFESWFFAVMFIIIFSIPLVKLFIVQFLSRNSGLSSSLASKGVPVFLSKLGLFFYTLPLFLFIILIIFSYYIYKKTNILSRIKFNEKYFFLFLIVVGLIYILILPRLITSFSLVRHSYFLVPILYVVMAKSITLIKNKKFGFVLVLVIILFNAFTLSYYYTETSKAPWREAAIFINEEIKDQEIILIDDSKSATFLFNYYYADQYNLNQKDYLILSDMDNINDKSKNYENYEKLILQLSGKKGFWLVSSRNFNSEEYYLEKINSFSDFKFKFKKEYKDLTIYYYVR